MDSKLEQELGLVKLGLVISKSSPEGNIFCIVALAKQLLEVEAGKKMQNEVTAQRSYEDALKVIKKYVPEISFID